MRDRSSRHKSVGFALLCPLVFALAATPKPSTNDVSFLEPAKPVVRLKARPFSLSDVRLLDGPFKQAMDRELIYLLQLEPDRLLAHFREFAGLKSKAPPYPGWESAGLNGHTLGHYLSACAMAYAAASDPRFRQRLDYLIAELAVCQQAHGDGYVAAIPEGRRVFREVAAGDIRARKFNLNGAWSPFYTLHKLFAGLRDAWRLAGNRQALEVEVRLADWVEKTLAGLDANQMQQVLACEFGGMNEVLADLYADTAVKRYLTLSHRFDHAAVYEPLSKGQDCLDGLHANTQIPKFVGLARQYELEGHRNERRVARFFWERVVRHHSYVTGGNSESEYFGPPDRLSQRLSDRTTETCNTYNLLKLTRQMFMLDPAVELADFYERALYNHILASQNPQDGMVTYFVPLRGGFHKEYSTSFGTFTCCHGSGMENHVKYADSIYFHGEESLYVNLFIPSVLDWKTKQIVLRQETRFPDDGRVSFAIECRQPVRFKMFLRHPEWAGPRVSVAVNGEPEKIESRPGRFIALQRTWRNGDRVRVDFPMPLRLESMPDNPARVALFHGPILLAGDLGPESDLWAGNFDYVPVLITGDRPVQDWVRTASDTPGAFQTVGAGHPHEVFLIPFYRLHHRRYAVYWDLCTEEDWTRRQAAARDEQRRIEQLEQATLDRVLPGDSLSEKTHNLQGDTGESERYNGRLYRLSRSKWFSYDLAVGGDKPLALVATYWGGERPGSRFFDIAVDDTVIASQELANNRPEQFFDQVYPIPPELTRGKSKITVKFIARDEKYAGGIFGLRIVRQP